ncbi:MAG: coproporphyrinogen oxidase [Bacteroidetes bacterium]|jgi:coproporphyrinogen III oxidase|nr:coproporphyrinogen oxidase [Bacteroidota bacterium]MDF2453676.1 coproporphyrinogen oxidase [Bacteroidota bacterium]
MEITKENISDWLKGLQDSICQALETEDGSGKFKEENWIREEGGGGRSRVIENGEVIEKGGVMFSAVSGKTPDFLLKEKEHSVSSSSAQTESTFFATGVSIVIHPKSPLVPIIHMNIRYFETSNGTKWLGGGIDLTPHYIVDEDASFFHGKLKEVCDKHHYSYYSEFKTWADNYFYINHRKETRGIGGIFFDRVNQNEHLNFEQNFAFWQDVGKAFAPIYVELMHKNKGKAYTDDQKQWQLLRRGRYVEFNLVYDKGTKFGLETNGRVESILMSLPAIAGWVYDYKVKEGSEEQNTLNKLKKGINWVS